MPKFADCSLSSFLDALASPEPTPGGGTAAAVAGAMGVSLLMMVAGLPKSRTGSDEERVAMSETRAALAGVRARLASLADADSDAYNRVVSAYRLPKSTDDEKAARKEAIQIAMKAATTTPLDTLRTAGEAMRLARIVAQHGNRNAVSDIGVGVGLLHASAEGAAANVKINLGGLQDPAFTSSAASDVDAMTQRIAEDAAAARRQLQG